MKQERKLNQTRRAPKSVLVERQRVEVDLIRRAGEDSRAQQSSPPDWLLWYSIPGLQIVI